MFVVISGFDGDLARAELNPKFLSKNLNGSGWEQALDPGLAFARPI